MNNTKHKTKYIILVVVGYFFGFVITIAANTFWMLWDKDTTRLAEFTVMNILSSVFLIMADYSVYKLIKTKFKVGGFLPVRYIPLIHIGVCVFNVLFYVI